MEQKITEIEKYSEWAAFSEAGHEFVAYLPDTSENNSWLLIISKDGEEVKREEIKLDYAPTFGPDVSDIDRLTNRTEQIIAELSD